MEEERRFVCKYCNKRYPSGKSLGGHIRTHMNKRNSTESGKEEQKFHKNMKTDSWMSQSGYVLRENPKKTRKLVDFGKVEGMMICRECGKGFQSLKALCGHMACHSDHKQKTSHKSFEDSQMDSTSDSDSTETSTRRRVSMRCRKKFNHFHFPSSSSSVSGLEQEQEQEEIAKCLMMLSKDSSLVKKVGYGYSSDTNSSEVLEAKSSFSKGETIKGGNFISNGGVLKLKNVEDCVSCSDNSDSGYFRNGPKKVESDVSVDGFFSKNDFYKSRVGFKSMMDHHDDDGASTKYDLRVKSKRNGDSKPEFTKVENSWGTDGFYCGNKSKNRNDKKSCLGFKRKKSGHLNKHECPICFRVFGSGQALGGHKRSHFIGGGGNVNNNDVVVMKESLIDLNFPPPMDEETMENSNGEFMMPW